MLLFLDPGSEIRDPGWVKNRIRDKHLGSATLPGGYESSPLVPGGCDWRLLLMYRTWWLHLMFLVAREPPLTCGYSRLVALLLYLVATESSPLVPGGCDRWLLLMYLVATVNVYGGHGPLLPAATLAWWLYSYTWWLRSPPHGA